MFVPQNHKGEISHFYILYTDQPHSPAPQLTAFRLMSFICLSPNNKPDQHTGSDRTEPVNKARNIPRPPVTPAPPCHIGPLPLTECRNPPVFNQGMLPGNKLRALNALAHGTVPTVHWVMTATAACIKMRPSISLHLLFMSCRCRGDVSSRTYSLPERVYTVRCFLR